MTTRGFFDADGHVYELDYQLTLILPSAEKRSSCGNP